MHHGLSALSVDTITEYSFGASDNLLDREDFGRPFFAATRAIGPSFWFFQYFPILRAISLMKPSWVPNMLSVTKGAYTLLRNVRTFI